MIYDFLQTNEEGEQVHAGSAWLKDGKIEHTVEPGFENLMGWIIYASQMLDGRKISAVKTPEEWMAMVPRLYTSMKLNVISRPDGAPFRAPTPGNQPDTKQLYIIRYELDLAVDRGTLNEETWKALYERAKKAANGNDYLLKFLTDEADPAWLDV